MKPTYSGFEAKKSKAFIDLPPAGAYVGEIKAVRLLEADGIKQKRTQIELLIDITEGEYANRYAEVWHDQKEQFGDNAFYKGVFRLTPPVEGDDDWRKRVFEANLWCIQESNDGYAWDWNEKGLKGMKVGFSVRNRYYTYNGKDRSTTEICQLETVDDVRNGKCRPAKDRDQREKHEEYGGTTYTQVDTEEVPWEV